MFTKVKKALVLGCLAMTLLVGSAGVSLVGVPAVAGTGDK
jgi:hypothetical protein